MFEVKVSGTVHALDDIRSAPAYARATFNDTKKLVAGADGKRLKFHYEDTFVVESISQLLIDLVTDSSNVEWDLKVTPLR